MSDLHAAALDQLVALTAPVDAAVVALAGFDRDAEELVTVTPDHLLSVLGRFRAGSLSDAEVVRWAEVVHLRDDIARDPAAEDLVNEVLIAMSSPELFGELAAIAPDLERRLRP